MLLFTQADASLTSLSPLLAHFCTMCWRQVAGTDNNEESIISSHYTSLRAHKTAAGILIIWLKWDQTNP